MKHVALLVMFAMAVMPAASQTPAHKPAFEVASTLTPSSQTVARAADTSKWEAVSVKPCPPNVRSGAPVLSPGRMTDCETFFGFINFAYIMFASGRTNPLPTPGASVEGGPSWIRSERFQITAKAEGTPTYAMMRGPMVQSILEDRFKLKVHRETREVPGYVLAVAKGGPKLQPLTEGTCIPQPKDVLDLPITPASSERACRHFGFGMAGQYKVDAEGISIEEFARIFLSSSVRQLVANKTGIAGLFDFRTEWSVPDLSANLAPQGNGGPPSIFTVLEQLGLRLESSKVSVQILVIDSVEKPTEN